MTTELRGRLWHRTTVVGLLAAFVLVASGCYYLPTAATHRDDDPTTRPWWCHSTGTGGHHVDPAYSGMSKGMLSWDDCITTSGLFDLVLTYVNQWPTAGQAEDAGFHQQVVYLPGMGTHHTLPGTFDPNDPSFDPRNPEFPGTEIDEHFDPLKPEFLMYDGNGRSAELVGMAWYVKTDPNTPPEGFPGNNDWWHRHEVLCHSSGWTVIGENLSDAQCEARGGVNVYLDDYWMLHAWIVEPWITPSDVFMNHHPCLLSSGPAPMHDPCWDDAGHGGH